jgi:hypothetical protein
MESRTNISEEMADSFIGPKSPKIKPKLNDTNPSLLNLSSGIFSKRTCEKDSFDSDKNGKNFISSNNLIPLFNKSSFFVSGHFKSSSNEVFKLPKINFSENQENESNDDDEENSNNILNFNYENEFINFDQDNANEEEKIIFCENINETSEEDDNEGLYILNMLRKGRKF